MHDLLTGARGLGRRCRYRRGHGRCRLFRHSLRNSSQACKAGNMPYFGERPHQGINLFTASLQGSSQIVVGFYNMSLRSGWRFHR